MTDAVLAKALEACKAALACEAERQQRSRAATTGDGLPVELAPDRTLYLRIVELAREAVEMEGKGVETLAEPIEVGLLNRLHGMWLSAGGCEGVLHEIGARLHPTLEESITKPPEQQQVPSTVAEYVESIADSLDRVQWALGAVLRYIRGDAPVSQI